MSTEERELYTVAQAADYLQLTCASIRSYIRQGKIKAFRVAGGRKILIPREELLGLLEPVVWNARLTRSGKAIKDV
ncbi:DNA-binding protein, excisionase family [Chthonomonas calidirosea]|uniref:DNA binding domain, excisionase family n=1 Tax=Chthonomonas calidirosea (strain DSM 23976 / ICMP 18418 / T49) TaxID=1303518 RepID=S0ESX7_CHTCT|nr:helix-turn-helix domain-containing protein [Chthonomonas calidirosea]CCW34384.1 DNA binding domain, excisionase family [Chthonomonas calidirosea T49]CEK13735.1 DNA-binding protein, excisionase family [Chthonomonas calidirosea]CEK13736.1 DNA-binding protein, excisionase family [Chthonomonas calidirosea]CEK14929.1 DNA-binding protein, excisionase family [Chthonomonas calidirosea]